MSPEKTIPKATLYGTLLTIVVYVIGSGCCDGNDPGEYSERSNAPFADAAAMIWGDSAGIGSGGAIVSTFWRAEWMDPFCRDKCRWRLGERQAVFLEYSNSKTKKGIPWVGIVISSVLRCWRRAFRDIA